MNRGDAAVEADIDAFRQKQLPQGFGHFGIEWSQQLRIAVDQRDRESAVDEVFSEFETDKAAAHDDGPPGPTIDGGFDAVGIAERAEGEDIWPIDPRNRWPNRSRSGSENYAVIRDVGRDSRGEILEPDCFRVAVDRHRFRSGSDLEAEAFAEPVGRADEQRIAFWNDAADVVRQAAIGKGDVGPALDHEDVGRFVDPSRAGGGRSTSGHTADDDEFHAETPVEHESAFP